MNTKLDSVAKEWVKIKSMFDANTNGNEEYGQNFEIKGEFDKKVIDFIDKLADITARAGFDCVIEGIKMDLWKDRAWNIYERAGLLAPLPKHLQEESEDEVEDSWDIYDNEDSFSEDEFDKQIYNG